MGENRHEAFDERLFGEFDRLRKLEEPQRRKALERILEEEPDLYRELAPLLESAAQSWPVESLIEAIGSSPIVMPESGSRIGEYVVDRLVEVGGFGEVYLASRADGRFQRQVAVKILNGLEALDGLEGFHREARHLAQLRHPGIAQLLDAGVTPEGRPYLMLEYVEGTPIDQFCRDRRLSARERIRLFVQLCLAVEHAHQKLVIHGDIKPANTLVTLEKSVKLLDFGISMSILRDGENSPPRSFAGASKPFAPPEQVEGQDLVTASDVFSLGVLLDLILREDAENGRRTGKKLLSPSRRSELRSIVVRATRPNPADRYPVVSELRRDLENYLSRRPVEAYGAGVAYRMRRLVVRNWLPVLGLLLLIVSLTTGGLVALWQAGIATRERDQAQDLSGFLEGLFEGADPAHEGGSGTTARQLLDRGARQIRYDLASQPSVRTNLMIVMGRAYRNLGAYAQASHFLSEALAIEGAAASPRQAEILYEQAVVAAKQGRHEEAEGGYRCALEMRVRFHGAESAEATQVRSGLAILLRRLGRYSEALKTAQEVVRIRTKTLGADHALTGAGHGSLGTILHSMGRLDEAEAHHERALQAYEAHLHPIHPFTADALNNLATVAKENTQFEKAGALYQRALEMHQKIHGGPHSEIALVLSNIGQLHKAKGELALAEEYTRRAFEMDRDFLGEDHPIVAGILNNLGVILKVQGKYDEATECYRKALRIRRALLKPDHPELAESLNNIATMEFAEKRYETAIGHFSEALEINRAALGEDHPLVGTNLNNLGRVREELGEAERAEALYRQAIEIIGRRLPVAHSRHLAVLKNLIRITAARDAWDEARTFLELYLQGCLERYGSEHARTREAKQLIQRLEALPQNR